MEYTTTFYNEWWNGLKAELTSMKANFPNGQSEKIIYSCASKMNISAATVRNYLDGTGTSPFTSLEIKETIQTILEENKNS